MDFPWSLLNQLKVIQALQRIDLSHARPDRPRAFTIDGVALLSGADDWRGSSFEELCYSADPLKIATSKITAQQV